jgi:UDP-N-acetylmuramoyl-tripeptide--D-alanyl-D-alanine ligase
MRPDGTVILNRDVTIFGDLLPMVGERRTVTFGSAADAEFRLLRLESSNGVTRVHALVDGRPLEYPLGIPGAFNAVNSLGAIATTSALDGDVDGGAAALATFEAVPGRARVLRLTIRGAGITLIDDSYNATPLSMQSTLQLLEESEPGAGGRRIAVLGDIAHLGARSADIHVGLADEARACGVDRVFTLGKQMALLHTALPAEMAAGHFDDKQTLVDALVRELRDGDVVTVKASVPSRFDHIVRMLKREARSG